MLQELQTTTRYVYCYVVLLYSGCINSGTGLTTCIVTAASIVICELHAADAVREY